MTRVYIEMYIETPYFAENYIFVAFLEEKGDVSWSKAITSLTSPSSVFPGVWNDFEKLASISVPSSQNGEQFHPDS